MKDDRPLRIGFSGYVDDEHFESAPASYEALADLLNRGRVASDIEQEICRLYPDLKPRVEISFIAGSCLWHGIVHFAGSLSDTLTYLAHGPLEPFIAAAHIAELAKVVAELIDRVLLKHFRKAGAPRIVKPFHTLVSPRPLGSQLLVVINGNAAGPQWSSPMGVFMALVGVAAIVAAAAMVVLVSHVAGR